jgi:hypothetical protein
MTCCHYYAITDGHKSALAVDISSIIFNPGMLGEVGDRKPDDVVSYPDEDLEARASAGGFRVIARVTAEAWTNPPE